MVGIVVSVILGSIGTLNLVNVILTGVIARQREFAAMRSIGMTKKQLTMILDGYGELLYQDGLSAFAIGSLTTEEELFVQKYKVMSIYSETAKRFVPLLKKYGMEPTGHLVTAWDTFSEEKPGAAERLEIAGQTVPDMIKELCKIGMYKG